MNWTDLSRNDRLIGHGTYLDIQPTDHDVSLCSVGKYEQLLVISTFEDSSYLEKDPKAIKFPGQGLLRLWFMRSTCLRSLLEV